MASGRILFAAAAAAVLISCPTWAGGSGHAAGWSGSGHGWSGSGYYGGYRGGYGYYRGYRGGYYGGGVYFGGPWWGWPGYYPYYPSYYYPPYPAPYSYPYDSSFTVAPSTPPVFIEKQPPAAPSAPTGDGSWYYCRDPQGYYPYVRTCNGNWEPVPAQPPAQR
jgi:hypothetical protein